MCGFGGGGSQPASRTILAAPDTGASRRRGDLEARLRRLRAGAAADVLTGPMGVPAGPGAAGLTDTLGGTG